MNIRLALVFGFVAAASIGSACAIFDPELCDAAEFCTSRGGELTMADCSSSGFWRFSDGVELTDIDEAADKCLCSSWACADDRTVELCTPTLGGGLWGLGDGDTATFSDGDTRSFREGAAICFGFASCEYENIFCTEGRWYLSCSDAEGENEAYLAWDGNYLDSEDSIERYCAGEPLETAQYSCKPLVVCEDNATEAECDAAECYWSPATMECGGTDSCIHDNETACNADVACAWN